MVPDAGALRDDVRPGLHTYVFGTRYARQVRVDGIRVGNVSGKLHQLDCPTP